jgi:hypothetical protein
MTAPRHPQQAIKAREQSVGCPRLVGEPLALRTANGPLGTGTMHPSKDFLELGFQVEPVEAVFRATFEATRASGSLEWLTDSSGAQLHRPPTCRPRLSAEGLEHLREGISSVEQKFAMIGER